MITEALTPAELKPLRFLYQVSRFLHEYLPSRLNQRVYMVLGVQGRKRFGSLL